ncbi:hypothetical protein DPMN_140728 [Dreissena polymorpha]|uniref:Uncharacterized protein n=1 Tax=Dreissena polymorpha TaxID=45954 RepID=A0A9D4JHN3_DREPO|nr:hypothetical protein DPMN_140728 [Dreissena polymorpha]
MKSDQPSTSRGNTGEEVRCLTGQVPAGNTGEEVAFPACMTGFEVGRGCLNVGMEFFFSLPKAKGNIELAFSVCQSVRQSVGPSGVKLLRAISQTLYKISTRN